MSGLEIFLVVMALSTELIIIPAVIGLWRWHTNFVRWQTLNDARLIEGNREFAEIKRDIAEIRDELRPNGGDSFEDRVMARLDNIQKM